MKTQVNEKIDWTRINNDVNGNPRYVCHFFNIPLTEEEKKEIEDRVNWKTGTYSIGLQYEKALQKARTIGGKKFSNKQYGGGIVFQSYNIEDTERRINEL